LKVLNIGTPLRPLIADGKSAQGWNGVGSIEYLGVNWARTGLELAGSAFTAEPVAESELQLDQEDKKLTGV